MRSFVALVLGDPARTAVAAYLDALRARLPEVAWTRSENLHLTLRFLGGVEPDRIAALTDRLAAVAARHPSFAMRAVGVGAFPSLARPRTLWVGIRAPLLPALAAAVADACAAAGFPADAGPFHPHVTLGRARERAARGRRRGDAAMEFLADDGGRDFGVTQVEQLVLFRSEPGAGGSRYTPLAVLPLGR